MQKMAVRAVALVFAGLAFAVSPRGTSAAATLQSLAARKFSHPTQAESRMLEVAQSGETAWCGLSKDVKDSVNDASKGADWGPERTVRAALIRWLYVDPEAVKMVARSGVSIVGARIQDELDLSRVRTEFPLRLSNCFIPEGVNLENADTRSLEFRRSQIGPINLNGARIEGSLDCARATILKDGDQRALSATGATVEGDVLLNHLRTNGLISISLAKIGGNLAFLHARFEGGRASGLEAINTQIQGALAWADIEGVGPSPQDITLDLTFAKVGGLGDYENSWPRHILINEFTYDKFDEPHETPKGLEKRLLWLSRHVQPHPPDFNAQPYLQLARVFSSTGRDNDAVAVLIEKDRLQREQAAQARGWLVRPFLLAWSWFLDRTIGYGHEPGRALGWSALIVIIGWLIFWHGHRVALMVPPEKDAYDSLNKTGEVPGYYQNFNSFVYSLETFLPFVDLHQGRYWSPSGNPVAGHRLFGRVLPWYLRFQILSGWLLSTLFLAGLTGLVHKD